MSLFDPPMTQGFNRLRVIDLETTGGDQASEIIEVGIVDVVRADNGKAQAWRALPAVSRLFRPRGEISFHAMAVEPLEPGAALLARFRLDPAMADPAHRAGPDAWSPPTS